MSELWSRPQSKIIVPKLQKATTFWQRTRGLLGTESIGADEGLWICPCSSVHTWFMNYDIDLIFLSKDLKVVKLCQRVSPFRMTLPKWSVHSVVEVQAGTISKVNLQIGEELYVGS